MRLDGKVAIVTGAGTGIGRAIAIALAKENTDVVINDIDLPLAESVAQEIKAMGHKALAVKADVSVSKEVNQMVEKTLEAFKRIDILVNNAGITKQMAIENETEDGWDKTMDVNLKSVFLCSQAAGKYMIKQRSGKIVNIASITGQRGVPGLVAYAASKGGLLQLTRAWATEWARYNINVNSVSPSLTFTPNQQKRAEAHPDFYKDRVKAIPLRRPLRPEDSAAAVVFLASPEADNITGQDIVVDGGIGAIHPGAALTLSTVY
ncbi:MAG: 3-oxoacyl-ACP reductase FabG [Chloroflexi bacterium]|nr:3-oxoacyl-ACP reductase FabG [Chloroflexota bacterium]